MQLASLVCALLAQQIWHCKLAKSTHGLLLAGGLNAEYQTCQQLHLSCTHFVPPVLAKLCIKCTSSWGARHPEADPRSHLHMTSLCLTTHPSEYARKSSNKVCLMPIQSSAPQLLSQYLLQSNAFHPRAAPSFHTVHLNR